MIKKILFAVAIIGFLTSCNSQSAFKYSESIVKKEQALTGDITTTEDKIEGFLKDEKYDSIVVAADRMEKLVDKALTEIKNEPAPDVKEAGPFKEASIKYFSFIKSLYTGYKDLGSAPTPEAREAEMLKLQKLVGEKTAIIGDMQRVQKKFAEANDFKLENQ